MILKVPFFIQIMHVWTINGMVTPLKFPLVSSWGIEGIRTAWETSPVVAWCWFSAGRGCPELTLILWDRLVGFFRVAHTENLSTLLRDEAFPAASCQLFSHSSNSGCLLSDSHFAPPGRIPLGAVHTHVKLPFVSRIHNISSPWLQKKYSGNSASHGMILSTSLGSNYMLPFVSHYPGIWVKLSKTEGPLTWLSWGGNRKYQETPIVFSRGLHLMLLCPIYGIFMGDFCANHFNSSLGIST